MASTLCELSSSTLGRVCLDGSVGPQSCCRSPAISTNYRHNEQIRISPVRVVNDAEEQLGVLPTAEAIRMAREQGMDLVEVAPNARPPVCRIMDYGKWRYLQQKKEDRSRANAKGGQLKELKFRTVRIGDNDLLVKVTRAREFLTEGNKVQFTLQFRGREMAHLNLGRDLMDKVKKELVDCSKVERDAKMEGRRMTLVLQPERKTGKAPKADKGDKGDHAGAGERLKIQMPAGTTAPKPPAAAAAAAPAPVAAAAAPATNP